jgi:CHAT domain-containing protein/tetratricopeptide (TPR) repeat protein
MNCLGQTDVAQTIEKEGLRGLEKLVNQSPSYQWKLNDFFQIYLLFKESDYNEKVKFNDVLGRNLLAKSLNASVILKVRNREELKRNFIVLEDFREQLKQEENWGQWGLITKILAENSYYDEDAFPRISRYYDELMSIWEVVGKKEQRKYAVLAGNHFMAVEQNFEKAATYFFKIIDSKAFNKQEKRRIYSNLSELYLQKKDLNRALEYGSKALEEENKKSILYLRQLTRSGKIYKELGNYVAARKCFLEAQKLLPPEKSLEKDPFAKINYVYVYSGLLGIELKNENLKKAASYVKVIEKNLPYLLDQGQGAYILSNPLMEYYTIKNDTSKYLDLEQTLLQTRDASQFAFYSKTLTRRGDYWFKQKKLDKALYLYNGALDLLKSTGSNEMVVYTQDEPHALVTLTKKLDLLYWKKQHGGSAENEQDFYRTTQQARTVLDQIRQSLTTQEAKQKLLDNAPRIYEYSLEAIWNLYQSSKNEAYLEEMFVLIEKSKAILLSEALNEDLAQHFGGVPDTLRVEEKRLVNDIKIYESKLLDAQNKNKTSNVATFQNILLEKRADLDQLKKDLEESYPKYYDLKFQDRITTIESVQTVLEKQKATFISYFVGKRNLYVLTLTNKDIGVRVESLSKNKNPNFFRDLRSLKRQISDVSDIKFFTKKEFKYLSTLSHRLYQLLLEPEQVTSKKLIISADGLLHYIPFEVLLTQKVERETINFKGLPYLLREHEISYQYTASLWLELLEKRKLLAKNNAGILGMAATYHQPFINIPQDRMELRQNLIELEGAKNEVYFLKQTYKGKFWMEDLATEANLKKSSGDYAIVHLALHGLVNNKMPMKSGLVFTENGDTIEDNFLFAYELSSLNLNTNLLVLSACSTGEGTYQKGEGVLSLGRGFMYAGASSILTTLWQINDQSTQRIMQYFYQNLYEGMDKDVALQQAKLSYIKEAKGEIGHPVFWAAYVLLGDTGTVAIYSKNSFWWWGIPIGGLLLGVLGFFIRKK